MTPVSRMEAAKLVYLADEFESNLFLEGGDKLVNVKSILGLLSLLADAPKEMTLTAGGTDEEAAASSLAQQFAQLCGEAEMEKEQEAEG